MQMLVLNAEEVRARAPLPALIECLRVAFRTPAFAPLRHCVPVPGAAGRCLLAMPAFGADGAGVVKLVTVFPDNPGRGAPTVQAAILLLSAAGTPVALLDGTTVTYLRTAAASALASSYLSRADSAHLVTIGTGRLAPFMAIAHAQVRPIRRISVCGRDPARAHAVAARVRSELPANIEVTAAASTPSAVAEADIVSCATTSATPVLEGRWLRPGTYVDLVGSFTPDHRECDDEVVRGARLFVDTFAGALAEAGDLLDPLRRGVIARERIEGELADLACGRNPGRTSSDETIVFKSVGTALEDLAAARMIVAASLAA
jgi:ornithine cyclodeaminase/alanine dehydrogenase-like protein (mu-crystallin family)